MADVTYDDLHKRKAQVGERVRCWIIENDRGRLTYNPDGRLGTVRRRRNSGFGFRSYEIELDSGRTVYLCQGAVWGFYIEEVWQAWIAPCRAPRTQDGHSCAREE